ncbi:MAG: hypothetical protein HRU80_06095 [Ignavibacteriales bacterium]|nr:hypothetical protein [Ignavibacteriaceae bacterium]QOJ28464.1 MAG: hypothetical protein HRU80_06095 [Ignavibacteriales bacterium]
MTAGLKSDEISSAAGSPGVLQNRSETSEAAGGEIRNDAKRLKRIEKFCPWLNLHHSGFEMIVI